MEFSRQEYWNRLSFSTPGDLPNPGTELDSHICRRILYHHATWEAHIYLYNIYIYNVCTLNHVSIVCLFATLCTVAHQAPLSMGIFQARILEWVAISFSRVSSRPRDQTWVSHIAGRIFTIWATREAHIQQIVLENMIFLKWTEKTILWMSYILFNPLCAMFTVASFLLLEFILGWQPLCATLISLG